MDPRKKRNLEFIENCLNIAVTFVTSVGIGCFYALLSYINLEFIENHIIIVAIITIMVCTGWNYAILSGINSHLADSFMINLVMGVTEAFVVGIICTQL